MSNQSIISEVIFNCNRSEGLILKVYNDTLHFKMIFAYHLYKLTE